MTETAKRNRARPRFKPARLKLAAIPSKQTPQRHTQHYKLLAQLREMILNSELRPGSALPEKMLCESFGVSRTPLREAFKVLASEGLIELRPHRTPQITLIDPDEITAVFEVMVALERLVGLRSASLAAPKEIAAIDAMHTKLVALHRDGSRAAYFCMNQQIHAEIARLAGNPVLQTTWGALTAKQAAAGGGKNTWPPPPPRAGGREPTARGQPAATLDPACSRRCGRGFRVDQRLSAQGKPSA